MTEPASARTRRAPAKRRAPGERSARSTAGTAFAVSLGAILVLGLAGTAWVSVRGFMAYGHLQSAQQQVTAVTANLNDPAQATSAIADIATETRAAHDLTSDPIWRAAEVLPWIGPQLAAVGTVAGAADTVASTALAPLAEVASSFSIDSFRPVNGALDLSGFVAIEAAATASAAGITEPSTSVAAINRDVLLEPLRKPITQVSDLLQETRATTDALARASALMPAMLGAEGPRDYLLLFQNNAEWRSLGGIPGAVSVIHTENGAISLAAQGSSTSFPTYNESVLPLGDDIESIYTQRPGRWMQNVTQIADFTVAAPLAREMWAREFGQQVDGVIALDPVALSYLLAATGPVTLPSGDVLTSDNAVPLLLRDVYERYEVPAEQDVFFASAAAAVFTALAGGQADPAALIAGLAQAGDENRLLVWSAHEADQALLSDTTIAGGLPVTDAEASRFGVFLNDGTGSKMDYFMTADVSVGWQNCAVAANGTATGDASLDVTLTNNAPVDAATLPRYITGGGSHGVPPGSAKTVAYLYLPEGFTLTTSSNSTDSGFGGGFHDGRRVLTFTSTLAPGESATASLSAASSAPGSRLVAARVTPTLAPPIESQITATCVG